MSQHGFGPNPPPVEASIDLVNNGDLYANINAEDDRKEDDVALEMGMPQDAVGVNGKHGNAYYQQSKPFGSEGRLTGPGS